MPEHPPCPLYVVSSRWHASHRIFINIVISIITGYVSQEAAADAGRGTIREEAPWPGREQRNKPRKPQSLSGRKNRQHPRRPHRRQQSSPPPTRSTPSLATSGPPSSRTAMRSGSISI